MSAPVDVLAVTRTLGIEGARMGSRAVGHSGPENGEWEDYVEVPVTQLAAIAELTERARALSDSITFRIDDPRCELHCKLVDAIARVGGGK